MEQNFDLEKLSELIAILQADPNVTEFSYDKKYDVMKDSALFTKLYTDDFRLISSFTINKFTSKAGDEYTKYNIVFKIPVFYTEEEKADLNLDKDTVKKWSFFGLGMYAGFETKRYFDEHPEMDKKKYVLSVEDLKKLEMKHLKSKTEDKDFWRADLIEIDSIFKK